MSAQPSLFDGATYDPAVDEDRLVTLLGRVYAALAEQRRLGLRWEWWTLRELVERCGGSEASVSARIRDLRKFRFGRHLIERRRRGDPRAGLHEYRMVK